MPCFVYRTIHFLSNSIDVVRCLFFHKEIHFKIVRRSCSMSVSDTLWGNDSGWKRTSFDVKQRPNMQHKNMNTRLQNFISVGCWSHWTLHNFASLRIRFLLKNWRTFFLWGHWNPCFRFRVTYELGFKTRVDSTACVLCLRYLLTFSMARMATEPTYFFKHEWDSNVASIVGQIGTLNELAIGAQVFIHNFEIHCICEKLPSLDKSIFTLCNQIQRRQSPGKLLVMGNFILLKQQIKPSLSSFQLENSFCKIH